jgi:hypothetical protein
MALYFMLRVAATSRTRLFGNGGLGAFRNLIPAVVGSAPNSLVEKTMPNKRAVIARIVDCPGDKPTL